MSEINLIPFCHPDRKILKLPFSIGNFTYAGDGYCVVRIPRRSCIEEVLGAPDISKLHFVQEIAFSPFNLDDAFAHPAEWETNENCRECNGSGSEHECPDCTCDCEDCDGTGTVTVPQMASCSVRGAIFRLRDIQLICGLSSVQFPIQPSQRDGVPFRFEGGVGLVMPMTRQEKTHHILEGKGS